jgi:enamine deaminase RidA (YjgF/YER057c/UK114 family)
MQSEQIGELAKALAAAQGEIRNAPKTSDNPFFKSRYADLAEVVDAVRGPLSKNGLAVVQIPLSTDGRTVTIHTVLMHTSGQWIDGDLTLAPVKVDPQGIGSATTYGRRYALQGFTGVAPTDDDDGNAASGKAVEQKAVAALQQVKQVLQDNGTKMKESVTQAVLTLRADTAAWLSLESDPEAIKQTYQAEVEDNPDLTADEKRRILKACKERELQLKSKAVSA